MILKSAEMSSELASMLVEIVFQTLYIYDSRASRNAVDDVITKALGESTFMKSFAAALVQAMEKQLKSWSHVGCYRLLIWSCFLLTNSQFASVSKNALCRVASAQASLLHIVMHRSVRDQRGCKKAFFHLFSKVCLKLTYCCRFSMVLVLLLPDFLGTFICCFYSHRKSLESIQRNSRMEGFLTKIVLSCSFYYSSFRVRDLQYLNNTRY